ncbi:MAG: hypothetical protein RI967_1429 [Planctomycetota bacterium]
MAKEKSNSKSKQKPDKHSGSKAGKKGAGKKKSPAASAETPAAVEIESSAAATGVTETKPSKKEKSAAKAARKSAERDATEAARAARKAAKQAAKKAAKDAPDAADTANDPGAAMPRFKHLRAKRLSSGKGPTPREIGESLVALFNAGKAEEAESTWYHRKIESIESEGQVFDGIKGVAEKCAWWNANFTIVNMRAAELYACATGFTVVYKGRVKGPDGVERDANEVGVYTVEKGRIVREQFMS